MNRYEKETLGAELARRVATLEPEWRVRAKKDLAAAVNHLGSMLYCVTCSPNNGSLLDAAYYQRAMVTRTEHAVERLPVHVRRQNGLA